MHNKNGPLRLVGEVQMFRFRVAKAEAELKALREQARQTKRRRKEAKQIAQRARKQWKRFKAELAELRQALAKAEAKLFQAGGRALARKAVRERRTARAGARATNKAKKPVRKSPAPPVASRPPKRPPRKQPAVKRTRPVATEPADAGVPATQPAPPQSSDPNTTTL